MALRHWDGFTGYAVADDLSHRYTVSGQSTQFSVEPGGGPFGLGGLRVGAVSLLQAEIYTAITSSTEVIAGFFIDWTDFDDSTDTYDSIFIFGAGATVIGKIILTNTGALKIETESYYILYDSSVGSYHADGLPRYIYPGWTRIEFRLLSHATTGQLELRVNGIPWCNLQNQDTGGSAITRVTVGTALDAGDGSGAKYGIGGLYVLDTTGSYNNYFLNDWSVQVLRPTSNDAIAFDPGGTNYQNVDDTIPHDADGTTNYTSTNAEVDTFGTTNTLTGAVCNVHAVNVCCIARCDDGQTQRARTALKHGVDIDNGVDVTLNPVHWKSMIQTYDQCPSTGGQFTKAEVEACKFGYESRA